MSLLGLQRDGTGPVLVWLHGFTQTRRSAFRFRSILAGTHQVVTIDLPGHGENAAITASLEETADLLAAALPPEPFALGGYSMGGRVALHLALRHPHRVRRLFLLSATLGVADDRERAARRARDEALATRIEAIGADAFLDEWLAQPLFADLPADPDERAARSHDAAGLASSLRHAGTGTQAWLGDAVRGLAVPAHVVAGARDAKFVREATLLSASLPSAHTSIVPAAGHAAHLELPEALAALAGAEVPV
jgi:2-succinyl-6-hydroxy-2,4-cyclohexadiene-1-carboxylate synthase